MSAGEQILYGLVGYPLEHSFSPGYFSRKFAGEHIAAAYRAFPLRQISELLPLIDTYPNLAGLNVTIPYKESVIPLLHEVDAEAGEIGAVNCIKITDGKTKGYNTDVIGFEKSLVPFLHEGISSALVLGTGGAARAVLYVLSKLDIEAITVSRTSGDMQYGQITPDLVSQHKLLINTTPLGMFPDTGSFPQLPYDAITSSHVLYDLVYNPAQTQFMIKGAARGATVVNGLQMLEIQAEESWKIWNS